MVKVLQTVNAKIAKAVNVLLILMLSLMTVLIFAQVIYRYVLKQPLSWSEELSRYFFSGITLFGAVVLYRNTGHINMSLLKDMIKIKFLQTAIDITSQILIMVFLIIVMRYGFPMSFKIARFENIFGGNQTACWN